MRPIGSSTENGTHNAVLTSAYGWDFRLDTSLNDFRNWPRFLGFGLGTPSRLLRHVRTVLRSYGTDMGAEVCVNCSLNG
eukprot:6108354-Pyramimonas_sp.AAC.1